MLDVQGFVERGSAGASPEHLIPVHVHGQNALSASQGVVDAGTVLTHTCGAKPRLNVKSDRRLPACNVVCCFIGNVWLVGL